MVKICNYQPNQTALTAAGTIILTIAQLLTGILQITQAAAVILQVPTGTLTYGGGFGIDQSIDWSVINTGSSLGVVSVQQSTAAHTIVGSGAVAIGTSGRYRTRITALNTAISYRIA